MNQNSLHNNPLLKDIDPEKLRALASLAEEAKGKSQSELLPFMMAASNSGRLKFSQEEIDAIIQVLKIGKTPQELRRIDKMCSLMKQMNKRPVG